MSLMVTEQNVDDFFYNFNCVKTITSREAYSRILGRQDGAIRWGATFWVQDAETPQFKRITRLVHPKFIFCPKQGTALGGIGSIIRIKQSLNM